MTKPLCIIVGFGAGNGFSLAKAFGRDGFQLALLSRDAGKHAALIAALVKENLTVLGKAGIRSLAYTLAQEPGRSSIHVGTVTIAGQVAAGTHFDPDKIAEAYLKLHRQQPGQFETEMIYQ